MDFSILLADLREVAEKYRGKTTEPQVSTLAYVDMFTKILKRAQKTTDKYEDQMTVLWVALNQLSTIYQDLSQGTARDQLCRFIFGMCARTVLDIQWAQLDEDSTVKKNFSSTVENVNEILSTQGFTRFQLILDLMTTHWTLPILTQVMSGQEDDDEEALKYIQSEDPEILKLRVEIMMKENCEEFALNLCTWSLKHPALASDLKLKEQLIYMLYKQEDFGKMQDVCEKIVCHDGIKVMSHLAKSATNQALCIRLAQIFLVQAWVKIEQTCCIQELLKLWIHHQYLADKDEERFLESIWTVAKVCRSTEQIWVLIEGVRKECGDMFIQLYTELCKYAINIDKGNMEKAQADDNKEEIAIRKAAVSKTCVRMAYLLKEYDFRISRICGLTAFVQEPTTDNLNLVNKLYWTIKNTSATSVNSKINPATIYEVERLLGMMRPESLNPDFSWKQLIPMCKKYKLDYARQHPGEFEADASLPEVKFSPQEMPAIHKPGPSTINLAPIQSSHPLQSAGAQFKVRTAADAAVKKPGIGKGRSSTAKSLKKKEQIDVQRAHLEQLLKQNKNLTREQIEKLLSEQFPRNPWKELPDGPSLSLKELDKTINDLKKSIYLETQYREAMGKKLSPLNQAEQTSTSSNPPVSSHPGPFNEHVSRQEQFQNRQQAEMFKRQHSAPDNSNRFPSPPSSTLHRQLSQGSVHPAHAHSQSRSRSPGSYAGSPPPAHSGQRNISHPSYQPFLMSQRPLTSSHTPASSSRQDHVPSSTAAHSSHRIVGQTNQHHNSSGKQAIIPLSRSSVPQVASSFNQKFNVLRPPGMQGKQQECAKIAQQIAELHEQQRMEKNRLEKIKLQGRLDGAKVALNSRSIPSSSQISDLLSLTLKGKTIDSEQSELKKSSTDATLQDQSKRKFEKKVSGHTGIKTLPSSTSRPVGPKPKTEKQHETPSLKTQKFYLATETVMKQLKKDGSGNVNLADSKLSVTPMLSMVVPKSLTSPNNQERLVQAVTNLVKNSPQSSNKAALLQTELHQPQIVSATSALVSSGNKVKSCHSSGDNIVRSLGGHNKVVTSQRESAVNMSNYGGVPIPQLQTMTQASLVSSNHDSPSTTASICLSSPHNLPLVTGTNVKMEQRNLQNLNTLASASVSVLGHSTGQHLTGIQQSQTDASLSAMQQLFGPQVFDTQQPLLQQPEPILAAPFFTIPQPNQTSIVVAPQQTINQPQLASLQSHSLQSPVSALPTVIPLLSHKGGHMSGYGFNSVSQPGLVPQTIRPVLGTFPQQQQNDITQPQHHGNVPVIVSTGKSTSTSIQSQFITTPELSPAVVQQILSSLKRSGALASKKASCDTQSNLTTAISATAECPRNQKPSERLLLAKKDKTVQNCVVEATKNILALRQQYENYSSVTSVTTNSKASHQSAIQSTHSSLTRDLPMNIGHLAVGKPVSAGETVGNSDIKTSKSLGLLPPSDATIDSSALLQTPASLGSIPDLPDLGLKEFQIDSILALDGDSGNMNVNTSVEQKAQAQELVSGKLSGNIDRSSASHMDIYSEQRGYKNIPVPAAHFEMETKDQQQIQTKHPHLSESLPGDSTYLNANRIAKERESKLQNVWSLQDSTVQQSHCSINENFKCMICGFCGESEVQLKIHLETSKCQSHIAGKMEEVTCDICKLKFDSMSKLREHIKTSCTNRVVSDSQLKDYEYSAIYQCSNCNFMNRSNKLLMKHVETCMITNSPAKRQATLLTLFQCNNCSETFPDKNSIYRHFSKLCHQVKVQWKRNYDNVNKSQLHTHHSSLPSTDTLKKALQGFSSQVKPNVQRNNLCPSKEDHVKSKVEERVLQHQKQIGGNAFVKEPTCLEKIVSTGQAMDLKDKEHVASTGNIVTLGMQAAKDQVKGEFKDSVNKEKGKKQSTKRAKSTLLQEKEASRETTKLDLKKENSSCHTGKASSQIVENSHVECKNISLRCDETLTSKKTDSLDQNETKSTSNRLDRKSNIKEKSDVAVSDSSNDSSLGMKKQEKNHVSIEPDAVESKLRQCLKARNERRLSEKFYMEEFSMLEKKRREQKKLEEDTSDMEENNQVEEEELKRVPSEKKGPCYKISARVTKDPENKTLVNNTNDKNKKSAASSKINLDHAIKNVANVKTKEIVRKDCFTEVNKTEKTMSKKLVKGKTVSNKNSMQCEDHQSSKNTRDCKEKKDEQKTSEANHVKLEDGSSNMKSHSSSRKRKLAIVDEVMDRKKKKKLVDGESKTKISPRSGGGNDSSKSVSAEHTALRKKRLIKKQKFFIEEMEPIVKKKIVSDKDLDPTVKKNDVADKDVDLVVKTNNVADKNQDHMENINVADKDQDNCEIIGSACKICDYTQPRKSSKYYLAKHYICTHNYGFTVLRHHILLCKYCSHRVPEHARVKMKMHVLGEHWRILIGQKCTEELNAPVDRKLSPVKKVNIGVSGKKSSVSRNCKSKSPIKNDKMRKHLKALAMRTRCAENLKKIVIQRESIEKDETGVDDRNIDESISDSQSLNHVNKIENSETPEKAPDVTEIGQKEIGSSEMGDEKMTNFHEKIEVKVLPEELDATAFEKEVVEGVDGSQSNAKTKSVDDLKLKSKETADDLKITVIEKKAKRGRPRKYPKGEEPYKGAKSKSWKLSLTKKSSCLETGSETALKREEDQNKSRLHARSFSSTSKGKSTLSGRTRNFSGPPIYCNENVNGVIHSKFSYSDKGVKTNEMKEIKPPCVKESSLDAYDYENAGGVETEQYTKTRRQSGIQKTTAPFNGKVGREIPLEYLCESGKGRVTRSKVTPDSKNGVHRQSEINLKYTEDESEVSLETEDEESRTCDQRQTRSSKKSSNVVLPSDDSVEIIEGENLEKSKTESNKVRADCGDSECARMQLDCQDDASQNKVSRSEGQSLDSKRRQSNAAFATTQDVENKDGSEKMLPTKTRAGRRSCKSQSNESSKLDKERDNSDDSDSGTFARKRSLRTNSRGGHEQNVPSGHGAKDTNTRGKRTRKLPNRKQSDFWENMADSDETDSEYAVKRVSKRRPSKCNSDKKANADKVMEKSLTVPIASEDEFENEDLRNAYSCDTDTSATIDFCILDENKDQSSLVGNEDSSKGSKDDYHLNDQDCNTVNDESTPIETNSFDLSPAGFMNLPTEVKDSPGGIPEKTLSVLIGPEDDYESHVEDIDSCDENTSSTGDSSMSKELGKKVVLQSEDLSRSQINKLENKVSSSTTTTNLEAVDTDDEFCFLKTDVTCSMYCSKDIPENPETVLKNIDTDIPVELPKKNFDSVFQKFAVESGDVSRLNVSSSIVHHQKPEIKSPGQTHGFLDAYQAFYEVHKADQQNEMDSVSALSEEKCEDEMDDISITEKHASNNRKDRDTELKRMYRLRDCYVHLERIVPGEMESERHFQKMENKTDIIVIDSSDDSDLDGVVNLTVSVAPPAALQKCMSKTDSKTVETNNLTIIGNNLQCDDVTEIRLPNEFEKKTTETCDHIMPDDDCGKLKDTAVVACRSTEDGAEICVVRDCNTEKKADSNMDVWIENAETLAESSESDENGIVLEKGKTDETIPFHKSANVDKACVKDVDDVGLLENRDNFDKEKEGNFCKGNEVSPGSSDIAKERLDQEHVESTIMDNMSVFQDKNDVSLLDQNLETSNAQLHEVGSNTTSIDHPECENKQQVSCSKMNQMEEAAVMSISLSDNTSLSKCQTPHVNKDASVPILDLGMVEKESVAGTHVDKPSADTQESVSEQDTNSVSQIVAEEDLLPSSHSKCEKPDLAVQIPTSVEELCSSELGNSLLAQEKSVPSTQGTVSLNGEAPLFQTDSNKMPFVVEVHEKSVGKETEEQKDSSPSKEQHISSQLSKEVEESFQPQAAVNLSSLDNKLISNHTKQFSTNEEKEKTLGMSDHSECNDGEQEIIPIPPKTTMLDVNEMTLVKDDLPENAQQISVTTKSANMVISKSTEEINVESVVKHDETRQCSLKDSCEMESDISEKGATSKETDLMTDSVKQLQNEKNDNMNSEKELDKDQDTLNGLGAIKHSPNIVNTAESEFSFGNDVISNKPESAVALILNTDVCSVDQVHEEKKQELDCEGSHSNIPLEMKTAEVDLMDSSSYSTQDQLPSIEYEKQKEFWVETGNKSEADRMPNDQSIVEVENQSATSLFKQQNDAFVSPLTVEKDESVGSSYSEGSKQHIQQLCEPEKTTTSREEQNDALPDDRFEGEINKQDIPVKISQEKEGLASCRDCAEDMSIECNSARGMKNGSDECSLMIESVSVSQEVVLDVLQDDTTHEIPSSLTPCDKDTVSQDAGDTITNNLFKDVDVQVNVVKETEPLVAESSDVNRISTEKTQLIPENIVVVDEPHAALTDGEDENSVQNEQSQWKNVEKVDLIEETSFNAIDKDSLSHERIVLEDENCVQSNTEIEPEAKLLNLESVTLIGHGNSQHPSMEAGMQDDTLLQNFKNVTSEATNHGDCESATQEATKEPYEDNSTLLNNDAINEGVVANELCCPDQSVVNEKTSMQVQNNEEVSEKSAIENSESGNVNSHECDYMMKSVIKVAATKLGPNEIQEHHLNEHDLSITDDSPVHDGEEHDIDTQQSICKISREVPRSTDDKSILYDHESELPKENIVASDLPSAPVSFEKSEIIEDEVVPLDDLVTMASTSSSIQEMKNPNQEIECEEPCLLKETSSMKNVDIDTPTVENGELEKQTAFTPESIIQTVSLVRDQIVNDQLNTSTQDFDTELESEIVESQLIAESSIPNPESYCSEDLVYKLTDGNSTEKDETCKESSDASSQQANLTVIMVKDTEHLQQTDLLTIDEPEHFSTNIHENDDTKVAVDVSPGDVFDFDAENKTSDNQSVSHDETNENSSQTSASLEESEMTVGDVDTPVEDLSLKVNMATTSRDVQETQAPNQQIESGQLCLSDCHENNQEPYSNDLIVDKEAAVLKAEDLDMPSVDVEPGNHALVTPEPIVLTASPVLDQATSPVPDRSTSPVPDQATSPVPDRSTSPVLDQATSPVLDQATSPVPDQATSPVPDRSTSPVLDQATSPVLDQATSPVQDQVISPVLDQATSPVPDQATSPVPDRSTSPVLDQATSPVLDQATSPVPDQATSPVPDRSTSPVLDQATSPVLDQATSPVPDQATSPVPDQATSPVLDQATSPVLDQVTNDQMNSSTYHFDRRTEMEIVESQSTAESNNPNSYSQKLCSEVTEGRYLDKDKIDKENDDASCQQVNLPVEASTVKAIEHTHLNEQMSQADLLTIEERDSVSTNSHDIDDINIEADVAPGDSCHVDEKCSESETDIQLDVNHSDLANNDTNLNDNFLTEKILSNFPKENVLPLTIAENSTSDKQSTSHDYCIEDSSQASASLEESELTVDVDAPLDDLSLTVTATTSSDVQDMDISDQQIESEQPCLSDGHKKQEPCSNDVCLLKETAALKAEDIDIPALADGEPEKHTSHTPEPTILTASPLLGQTGTDEMNVSTQDFDTRTESEVVESQSVADSNSPKLYTQNLCSEELVFTDEKSTEGLHLDKDEMNKESDDASCQQVILPVEASTDNDIENGHPNEQISQADLLTIEEPDSVSTNQQDTDDTKVTIASGDRCHADEKSSESETDIQLALNHSDYANNGINLNDDILKENVLGNFPQEYDSPLTIAEDRTSDKQSNSQDGIIEDSLQTSASLEESELTVEDVDAPLDDLSLTVTMATASSGVQETQAPNQQIESRQPASLNAEDIDIPALADAEPEKHTSHTTEPTILTATPLLGPTGTDELNVSTQDFDTRTELEVVESQSVADTNSPKLYTQNLCSEELVFTDEKSTEGLHLDKDEMNKESDDASCQQVNLPVEASTDNIVENGHPNEQISQADLLTIEEPDSISTNHRDTDDTKVNIASGDSCHVDEKSSESETDIQLALNHDLANKATKLSEAILCDDADKGVQIDNQTNICSIAAEDCLSKDEGFSLDFNDATNSNKNAQLSLASSEAVGLKSGTVVEEEVTIIETSAGNVDISSTGDSRTGIEDFHPLPSDSDLDINEHKISKFSHEQSANEISDTAEHCAGTKSTMLGFSENDVINACTNRSEVTDTLSCKSSMKRDDENTNKERPILRQLLETDMRYEAKTVITGMLKDDKIPESSSSNIENKTHISLEPEHEGGNICEAVEESPKNQCDDNCTRSHDHFGVTSSAVESASKVQCQTTIDEKLQSKIKGPQEESEASMKVSDNQSVDDIEVDLLNQHSKQLVKENISEKKTGKKASPVCTKLKRFSELATDVSTVDFRNRNAEKCDRTNARKKNVKSKIVPATDRSYSKRKYIKTRKGMGNDTDSIAEVSGMNKFKKSVDSLKSDEKVEQSTNKSSSMDSCDNKEAQQMRKSNNMTETVKNSKSSVSTRAKQPSKKSSDAAKVSKNNDIVSETCESAQSDKTPEGRNNICTDTPQSRKTKCFVEKNVCKKRKGDKMATKYKISSKRRKCVHDLSMEDKHTRNDDVCSKTRNENMTQNRDISSKKQLSSREGRNCMAMGGKNDSLGEKVSKLSKKVEKVSKLSKKGTESVVSSKTAEGSKTKCFKSEEIKANIEQNHIDSNASSGKDAACSSTTVNIKRKDCQRRSSQDEAEVPDKVLLEDEDAQDFKKRTKIVKTALKLSSIAPYESDFNIDGTEIPCSGQSFKSFESKFIRVNADTASIHSNTSLGKKSPSKACSKSDSTPGDNIHVQTRSKIKQTVSPAIQRMCVSPQKASLSIMTTRLVQSSGSMLEAKEQIFSPHIFTCDNVKKYRKKQRVESKPPLIPPLPLPSQLKDKSILPITGQGKISVVCSTYKPSNSIQEANSNQVKSRKCISSSATVDESSTDDVDICPERRMSKVKTWRELQKKDRPFRWEDSPCRETRSKGKTKPEEFSDQHSSGVEDSVEKVPVFERLRSRSRSKSRETGREITDSKVENSSKVDKKHCSACDEPSSRNSNHKTQSSTILNKKNNAELMNTETRKSVGPSRKGTHNRKKREVDELNSPEEFIHDTDDPPSKMCKLDGTSGSPEKDDVLESNAYADDPSETIHHPVRNLMHVYDSHRPAVRQIYHDGKLFEIQKGSVIETDIQAVSPNKNSPGTSSQHVGVCGKISSQKRSRYTSVHASPLQNVSKRDDNVAGSIPGTEITEVVDSADLDDYIAATLNEIRKQRQSNVKWTVKKTKAAQRFPYSFKRKLKKGN